MQIKVKHFFFKQNFLFLLRPYKSAAQKRYSFVSIGLFEKSLH